MTNTKQSTNVAEVADRVHLPQREMHGPRRSNEVGSIDITEPRCTSVDDPTARLLQAGEA
jgi:hypothetical protein